MAGWWPEVWAKSCGDDEKKVARVAAIEEAAGVVAGRGDVRQVGARMPPTGIPLDRAARIAADGGDSRTMQ
jgi:hypothetical protein